MRCENCVFSVVSSHFASPLARSIKLAYGSDAGWGIAIIAAPNGETPTTNRPVSAAFDSVFAVPSSALHANRAFRPFAIRSSLTTNVKEQS
jgi:nicotinamide mononucleotide (NMN) deamidase PncC